MTHLNSSRSGAASAVIEAFQGVRGRSLELAEGLSDADATVQSMEDASPAKWHLAHTTWFFETFVLAPHSPGYRAFDDRFAYLFNSYYNGAGPRHARPRRGLITRPSLAEVVAYRRHVDAAMEEFLPGAGREALDSVVVGLNHEQQHQELLLTDLLHLFAQNPFAPAYRKGEPLAVDSQPVPAMGWVRIEGGLKEIGAPADGFAFDCERPRHTALVRDVDIASRAVTAGEWIEFMADGGYTAPGLWLSDGFARAEAEGWTAPLYWSERGGEWWTVTLRGPQPVDRDAPVCHISYFEADAFATWAGARLPTEAEWELAAADYSETGNLAGSGRLRPRPQRAATGLAGLFGDVWEWTSSAFLPYPGFRPLPGTMGEYNGKFMSGQMVLKGGSCATPEGHVRASYRNFFPPEKRWQFSGLRLAREV
ncbi:MAG: ergothioneine biosynthesis protein EgtB [Pseudomonadota bacterium]